MGHRIGMADIDGDGKFDMLTAFGWFKNLDANADQWDWHGKWKLDKTGFPVIGYVNREGKLDIT